MSDTAGPGPGRREVAHRLFAAEFDDATVSFSESDEDRAPNYVLTPGGARVNRLFVVGVLTEVEPVSEDVVRARVVDPTGAFVCYAGQYQPDERAYLERAEPPMFLALTGKARTFQPEDSDAVYTSVRPESVNEVDAETRDRWTLQAAEHTIDRVGTMAAALSLDARGADLETILLGNDVPESLASGIPRAIDAYETGPAYLRALYDLSVQAGEVVAGEREEVDSLVVDPDDPTDVDLAPLPIPRFEATGGESETAPSGGETDGEATEADEPQHPPEEEQAAASATSREAPGAETDAAPSDGDGVEAAEPDAVDEFDGEFELDADERAELESEYGTEFQSGAEVEEPGEADIDAPSPVEAESETDDADDETAADEHTDDLEDLVLSVMAELDEGDGAPRAAVVETATERADADREAVEEAIQSALLDGLCYEPDDATLQPI